MTLSTQVGEISGDRAIRSHRSHFKTITVRDVDALAPHVAAWDRLAWDAPQNIPTLLPGWVDAYLRHRLKPNEEWLCSFAYAGGELVGVLPVIVMPHPVLGRRWPLLYTPFDECTRSGDIALAPAHAGAALRALLEEVRRQVPGHLGLHLQAVRQSSPVWHALRDKPEGYWLYRGQGSMYAYLDVQGDFDRYLADLGNKMRQNLRRGRRKLEARGPVSVELRRGAAAGEDFLAEFLRLEASGWKGRMGTAILNDPAMAAFYTSLVRNSAAKGQLEWHNLRVGDRLVAAQLGIRCGTSLVLPKYAYDEEFAEGIPGHLLVEEVIKEAFSRPELSEINPMSYGSQHQLFRMACDEYTGVHLVSRTAPTALFHLPRIALRSLYQDHVRPRIPQSVKQAYRKFKVRDIWKFKRGAPSR